MLEFKKRTLGIRFEGKEVEIRFPTALELEGFQKEVAGKENVQKTLSFLGGLGLPDQVGEQLELGHLMQIVESLASVKKR